MSERNSIVFKSGTTPPGTDGFQSILSSDEIIHNNNNNNNNGKTNSLHKNGSLKKKIIKDNSNLLQISIPAQPHQPPYQQVQYGVSKSKNMLLPTNVTIPIGLAQVFIGFSMVICGSFAFRYRSYLFYYGTGLWAGVLTGLSGALAIMCTKKGLPKLRSMCGGNKWQLHVFIGCTMLALTSSVLLSIFSTSGLMQDTMYTVDGREIDSTVDDDLFEKRKSTGVAINALLLLLAMLEILLAFCSFGIVLRVVCGTKDRSSSLVSSDSMISQMTVRDILGGGTGPEYEARKDRLFRWLTHQGRNLFLNSSATSSPKGNNIGNMTLVPTFNNNNTASRAGRGGVSRSQFIVSNNNANNYLVPHLIAIQPSQHHGSSSAALSLSSIPNAHSSRRILYHHPQQLLIPHIESSNHNSGPTRHYNPHHPPYPMLQPIQMSMPILMAPPPSKNLIPIQCPMPPPQGSMGRRAKIPIYSAGSNTSGSRRNNTSGRRRRRIGSLHGSTSGISGCGGGGGNGSFKSGTSSQHRRKLHHSTFNNNNNNNGTCRSSSSSSATKNKKLKNQHKEKQISEEEIGKTYTGLDQEIAENFICSSMDKY